jgi:hypothetical protein
MRGLMFILTARLTIRTPLLLLMRGVRLILILLLDTVLLPHLATRLSPLEQCPPRVLDLQQPIEPDRQSPRDREPLRVIKVIILKLAACFDDCLYEVL